MDFQLGVVVLLIFVLFKGQLHIDEEVECITIFA